MLELEIGGFNFTHQEISEFYCFLSVGTTTADLVLSMFQLGQSITRLFSD